MTERELSYIRQVGIVTPDLLPWPITMIGLGGIGSNTVLGLAMLGFRDFALFDPDVIANYNLPNQMHFRCQDVGRLKIERIAEVLAEHGITNVRLVPERVTKNTPLAGIVVSGVDSMTSRKAIRRAVKRSQAAVPLLLDGRLGGEQLELLTVRPGYTLDQQMYRHFMFSDKKGAALPCTAQSVYTAATVLSGFIGTQIIRWVRNEPYYRHLHLHLPAMRLVQEYPSDSLES